jgi:hypothetical protein
MSNAHKSEKTTVLILVHPGSACGSANYNLGSQLGSAYREQLAGDLSRWTGDMLVIDGGLSEELKEPDFQNLGQAIKEALGRCRSAGFRTRRSWGCDNTPPHQADRIRSWTEDGTLDPAKMRVSLTGAWYNEDGGGCVGDVETALKAAGFEVDVRDSVVCELQEDLVHDDTELDAEDECGTGLAP